ncbi:MAG TPA: TonB-dependent receptor [Parafilimonas sp.]|nr:TonB-dependent receptor [Parafilimonas sp.]
MRVKFTPVFLLLCSPLFLQAQSDSTADVKSLLKLSLEELMNVKVVTASGQMQTTAEAPSTITVITAKQIEERGYEQLEDALRDVPGIDMIHVNGYAPTLIYFRGMYGAENLRALLMIDGIVENNILGSNDMAGPAYSLHNVDRIEIIWGPVSAIYGANAFGGVINIITKKGQDINGFHAEAGYGSFNTNFEKIEAGIKKSKFEFSLAGTLYSTDGPKFTNRDPNYDASYVDKAYSVNTALSYYGSKTKTTLGFRMYDTPMGWGTYSNSPTVYLGLPPQGNSNSGILGVLQSPIRGEHSGLDESYLKTWFLENDYKRNTKTDILARVVYRETGIAEDSYIYITLDGRKLLRLPIATWSNRIEGDLTGNFILAKNQTLSAGIEYTQDNVEAGERGITVDYNTVYLLDGKDTLLNLHSTYLPRKFDIRNNFGSYAQYVVNTKLLGKTNFTAGARYDNNSYFGNAFSPRLAIVNQPGSKLTFKLQVGKAFRSPTNLEIHQINPDSNFQLKQEQLVTYEVNAIYAPTPAMRLQANVFHNDLKHVIVLSNLAGLTPNKNPATYRITGFETVADFDITKNISGFANFTYQHTWFKNLENGNSGRIAGVAAVKGNVGFTAHINDLFILTVSGNWVGKRNTPATDPLGSVKGYFLTNCVISTRELFNNRITVSLNVHNIFNTKWFDPGFRTADGFLYATILEQPGMNGLIKAAIRF